MPVDPMIREIVRDIHTRVAVLRLRRLASDTIDAWLRGELPDELLDDYPPRPRFPRDDA